MAPRLSPKNPAVRAALLEMAKRLDGFLRDKKWIAQDLVRAAQPFMPDNPSKKKGTKYRFAADTVSHIMSMKSMPVQRTIDAICAALGIREEDLVPEILRRRVQYREVPNLLTLIPGRPGYVRVFVDEEVPLKIAFEIVRLIEESKRPQTEGGHDAS